MILTKKIKLLFSKIEFKRNLNKILKNSEKLSKEEQEIVSSVSPYTMTSRARIIALINSVKYLQKKGVSGDFVECGVWKGGSMLAAAMTLELLKANERNLYLFDTFSGMTEPSSEDIDLSGTAASELLSREECSEKSTIWCLAGIDEVRKTMKISSYPEEKIHYIPGDVLNTLEKHAPKKIALLRLDTDWYESTKHELEVLFDRISIGGVLVIDDYGHWKGARKAVDEFISRIKNPPVLHKIDYTGRISIKMQ